MRIPNASTAELTRLSDYKSRILSTILDLEKTVEEGDKQHTQILFERLEKQVLNRRWR
jgi:hypothetical protein